MTAPYTLTNYHGVLDGNSKFSTLNQAGYVVTIPANLVAAYNFNGTDTMQMVKNGFSFEGNSDVAVSIPGKSLKGIPYVFDGIGNDITQGIIAERWFYFDELTEVWMHQKFMVPANYKHRDIYVITVSGSLANWQIGDNLVTVNGGNPGSTATIYGIVGNEVRLEFTQNPSLIAWGTSGSQTTITNTTRSETRLANHNRSLSNNNKLFVLVCDAYSSFGVNPTFGFEQRSVDGLYSSLYVHVAADHQVAGTILGDQGEFLDFITADQIGKTIEICYGVRLASAVGVSDGVVELWIKREGESTYTRKMNATGLPIWKRAGIPQGLRAGYLHGAQNSGYYETTTLTDTRFKLLSIKPSFLV